jgi:hypothetical protein
MSLRLNPSLLRSRNVEDMINEFKELKQTIEHEISVLNDAKGNISTFTDDTGAITIPFDFGGYGYNLHLKDMNELNAIIMTCESMLLNYNSIESLNYFLA